MLSRRDCLLGSSALLTFGALGVRTAHADELVAIRVPHASVGAVISVLLDPSTTIEVDKTLGPGEVAVGDTRVQVADRVLLKGRGANRRRFLDDPRNALKVALSAAKGLSALHPESAATYDERRRRFARAFAKECLGWTRRLRSSSVAGQRIANPYGRRYLLEWAGAVIDKGAVDRGPETLETLRGGPETPTLEAYRAYIQALVAALTDPTATKRGKSP